MRQKRHAPYCACPQCGPVDKWAVYDGNKVFSVENLSAAEVARRIKHKQLKAGRYWLKWEDVPVEDRSEYLGVKDEPVFPEPANCPFCASLAVLTGTHTKSGAYMHFVVCTNHMCGCSLFPSFTPLQAVRKWNRRVIQLRAVLKKEAA